MEKLSGNINVLSDMQITADMEKFDAQSKTVLRNKEVLAVILQEVIEEYKGYSRKEIMQFIESNSMTDDREVSAGRTNTQVRVDNAEFVQLNEKVSFFDLIFRARNPKLSIDDVLVSLHVNIEAQKNYQPGYPIEKRGLYYLARSLSSQLSVVTESTDYNELEKCYSIWICRDNIPPKARYSISVYEMENTRNTGMSVTPKENYNLMTLVVIKLGQTVYNGGKGDEGYELLHFLNAVMYPHRENFMDTISEYIDFSNNEELWKETEYMTGLGQSILEEGFAKGIEQGIEQGIRALILDNLEEQISREKIIVKLQKRFGLTEEKAIQYYDEFAVKI